MSGRQTFPLHKHDFPSGTRFEARAVLDEDGEASLILLLRIKTPEGMRRASRIKLPWPQALELARAIQGLAQQARVAS